jgi:Kelch motif
MLVLGLTSAAYNPATNKWHPIARPNLAPGQINGWTGHEAIVWEGTCCGGQADRGAAYNLATNKWRVFASPLERRVGAIGAWTGKELVVAGGVSQPNGRTVKAFRDAAAYNPVTRTWRKLAPMPLGRSDATPVWDGREILFLGGRTGNRLAAYGMAYNPATNRWRWLPRMQYPRSGFAAVWTGRHVLVWGGLTAAGIPPPHGEAFDPATSRWTALPIAPLHGRVVSAAAWTGRQMIVWGGYIKGKNTRSTFLEVRHSRPSHPPSGASSR